MSQRSRSARSGTGDGRPESSFTVAARVDGDRTIVVVRGELDIDAAQELDGALGAALLRPVRGVTVDLSGVTFCDCSGLNVLLAARLRGRARAMAFTIRAASPAVRRLLTLTGTLPLFSLEEGAADGRRPRAGVCAAREREGHAWPRWRRRELAPGLPGGAHTGPAGCRRGGRGGVGVRRTRG